MPVAHANLIAHPTDGGPLTRLEVALSATRTPAGVSLCFDIGGPVGAIVWPAAAPPARADGLWRHTCFECFLALPGHNTYYEWNASPSGGWAVYRFGGYRERLADPEGVAAPTLARRHGDERVRVELALELGGIPRLGRRSALEFAAAAVFEDERGGRVHFALAHPGERADFHDRRGFVLTLGPAP